MSLRPPLTILYFSRDIEESVILFKQSNIKNTIHIKKNPKIYPGLLIM